MNQSCADGFSNFLIRRAAHAAYGGGRETEAANIYAEAADREQDKHNVAAEMEAKRWQGNSLMCGCAMGKTAGKHTRI